MKTTSLTGLLVALSAISSGIQLVQAAPPKNPPTPKHAPKITYLLKTEAVDGKKFDGLLVSTYHTDAGGNAVVLVPEGPRRGVPGYIFNGDELWLAIGKSEYEQYPLQLALPDPSASWGTTSANIFGSATKGLNMTESGYLIVTGYSEKVYKKVDRGAHWRVCEWSHGVPELFWNNPETWDNIRPKYNPATCSRVNIKMVKHTE